MNLTRLALTGSLLASLAASGSALAQTTPNPGERPINTFVMKGSHNSYERSEPLWQQIERYSTFSIELDLYYQNDIGPYGPTIMVEHFCNSSHNAQTLEYELAELATPTAGQSERVIFLYLDMKTELQGVCYDDWPDDPDMIMNAIMSRLEDTLGLANIYPASVFQGMHNSQWPSMQEINRLGYRYVVFLDLPGYTWPHDTIFTVASTTAGVTGNTAMLNIGNGNDLDGRNGFPIEVGPRWLNRCFSNRDLCSEMNGAYWDDSVNRGFNIVATNCIDDPETITDPRIHSPSPLYVTTSAPNSELWGTWNEPMTSFVAAVNRVSAAVTISAAVGTYDVPPNYRITRPMKITARAGLVRVQ